FGYFGRAWTWISSICAVWPGRSDDRYTGPWTAATANPVLVVGNFLRPGYPVPRSADRRRAAAQLPAALLRRLGSHGLRGRVPLHRQRGERLPDQRRGSGRGHRLPTGDETVRPVLTAVGDRNATAAFPPRRPAARAHQACPARLTPPPKTVSRT